MKEIPDRWCWVTVGDVGNVTGGLTQNSKRDQLPLQLPFLRVANVYANELRLEQVLEIGVREDEVSRSLLEKGDLLVVEGNGSLDQIGRVALWNGAIAPCLHQNHLIKVRFVPVALGRFALYWLLSSAGRDQITRVASSTSGLHTLSISKVQALEMPLAPFREQERISDAVESYFSRLDDTVTTLERVERNLKRYRASVLKAAVEGRLVPTEAVLAKEEGRDYEPASVLLERILTERRRHWSKSGKKGKYQEPAPPATANLPELPEGWCWASAESICEAVDSGTTPSKEHFADQTGVPFIKVYNLTFDGSLDFTKQPTFVRSDYEGTKMGRSRVEPGDVLMNIVGPPLGKVSIVPPAHARWNINQAIVRFRPLPGLLGQFLSFFLQSEQCKRWLSATAKTTTSQVNLATTTCRRLAVPVPPFAEQLRIVERVEEQITAASVTRAQINASTSRASRLRQSILKGAFEGRLVDQDPNDEPASVLLERIKAEQESAKLAKASRSQRSTGKKQVGA